MSKRATRALSPAVAGYMSGQEEAQVTPPFDWVLWLQWVLASMLGWLLGWVLVGEVGIGVGIGIAQWLVLRPLVRQAGRWILASIVGWAAGWAVVIGLFPPEVGVLAGLTLGVMLGTTQWLMLRQWVYRAGWWIVISALGWSVGLTGILGASLAGAVAGAVTGIALELLVRHLRPEAVRRHALSDAQG